MAALDTIPARASSCCTCRVTCTLCLGTHIVCVSGTGQEHHEQLAASGRRLIVGCMLHTLLPAPLHGTYQWRGASRHPIGVVLQNEFKLSQHKVTASTSERLPTCNLSLRWKLRYCHTSLSEAHFFPSKQQNQFTAEGADCAWSPRPRGTGDVWLDKVI
jgi:hypothetical protein